MSKYFPTRRMITSKIYESLLLAKRTQPNAKSDRVRIKLRRQRRVLRFEVPLESDPYASCVMAFGVRAKSIDAAPFAKHQVPIRHAEGDHRIRNIRAQVILANRLKVPHSAFDVVKALPFVWG